MPPALPWIHIPAPIAWIVLVYKILYPGLTFCVCLNQWTESNMTKHPVMSRILLIKSYAYNVSAAHHLKISNIILWYKMSSRSSILSLLALLNQSIEYVQYLEYHLKQTFVSPRKFKYLHAKVAIRRIRYGCWIFVAIMPSVPWSSTGAMYAIQCKWCEM